MRKPKDHKLYRVYRLSYGRVRAYEVGGQTPPKNAKPLVLVSAHTPGKAKHEALAYLKGKPSAALPIDADGNVT